MMMGFTDQIKAALAKKQAAQHPDADTAQDTKSVRPGTRPTPSTNKPVKKVTSRGR